MWEGTGQGCSEHMCLWRVSRHTAELPIARPGSCPILWILGGWRRSKTIYFIEGRGGRHGPAWARGGGGGGRGPDGRSMGVCVGGNGPAWAQHAWAYGRGRGVGQPRAAAMVGSSSGCACCGPCHAPSCGCQGPCHAPSSCPTPSCGCQGPYHAPSSAARAPATLPALGRELRQAGFPARRPPAPPLVASVMAVGWVGWRSTFTSPRALAVWRAHSQFRSPTLGSLIVLSASHRQSASRGAGHGQVAALAIHSSARRASSATRGGGGSWLPGPGRPRARRPRSDDGRHGNGKGHLAGA